MQYHIQTAPIWDAFKENDGCPLCKLYARTESRLVKQYLGEAVMEPDYRVRVNERGFCDKHLVKLYDGNNKLGLALQLHTRTEHIIKCIDVPCNAKQARKLADRLEKTANTCVICDEVDEVMNRYYYTVAQMYLAEAAFPEVFAASYGFCMPHFIELLKMVSYAGKKQEAYASALTRKQIDTLRKNDADLERFTKRFDYRSTDKFSGGTDDAIAVAINKLKGNIIDLK